MPESVGQDQTYQDPTKEPTEKNEEHQRAHAYPLIVFINGTPTITSTVMTKGRK